MRIEPGTIADYDALGVFHYRSGRPATFVRVLVARAPREARPVGVLVVSMPTLNARWRDLFWAGRYTGLSRSEAARRLNGEVRTISRVVVDPRYRGRSIGTRLVRSLLDDAPTRRTEAVAAMGAWCGFFERAGMRAGVLGPSPRDMRLRAVLDLVGAPAWALADPARVRALLRRDDREGTGTLRRSLHAWANASRATRRLADEGAMAIARAAARSIDSRMVAYAHERGAGREGGASGEQEASGSRVSA